MSGEQAEALRCPVCGAPLRFKSGQEILTCEYCQTPVRVGSDGQVVVEEKSGSEVSPAEVVSQVADTVESVSKVVSNVTNLASLPMRLLYAARPIIAGCLLAIVLAVVAGFLAFFFLVRK
jgi:uncharacterized Zn finger protein (UPF0148 family)